MRLAVSLALALFVGQALVFPATAAPDVCAQACPDDRPDGTCDPTCADCTCCSHAARPLAVIATAIAPAAAREHAPAIASSLTPSAADPRDVFHVPRPLA